MAYLLDDDRIERTTAGIRFTLKGQEILSLSRLEVEQMWLETQSEAELLTNLDFHVAMVAALQAELAERRAQSK